MKFLQPRLERLEPRQLLAADSSAIDNFEYSVPLDAESSFPRAVLHAEGEHSPPEAESEDAQDLVSFAKLLSDANVRFFCTAWAQVCTAQRQLFEDGGQFLPFEEVSNPDHSRNQLAVDEGIFSVITWQFGDASNREERLMSLDEVASAAGITIPQSSTPSIASIPSKLSFSGALHVGVDAYDPNGDALQVTVESSDPTLLTAQVLSGNRSLRLDLPSYGEMTFELFEQEAPRATGRIVQLAEANFYDGVSFHRVIRNFMAQSGDPTGTGSGGSNLGVFDDEFHPDLQHNSSGLLSFAKSGDDTNNSQFFITDVPTPHLDFNHSVFGMLTEGDQNRNALNDVLTTIGDRPLWDTAIRSATIFEDSENATLRLMPTGVGTGVVDVTVSVMDAAGNQASETFSVTIDPDPTNGAPFLADLPVQAGCTGHSRQLTLPAVDGEGDTLTYSVEHSGDEEFDLVVDSSSGVVTITPPEGFQGEFSFLASVSQLEETTTQDGTDTQRYTVSFGASTHQNPENSLDISGDGSTSAIDALLVVGHLNTVGSANRVFDLPEGAAFLDINSDCAISAIDALSIINHLNTRSGEGEASESPGEELRSWMVGRDFQESAWVQLFAKDSSRREERSLQTQLNTDAVDYLSGLLAQQPHGEFLIAIPNIGFWSSTETSFNSFSIPAKLESLPLRLEEFLKTLKLKF